MKRRDDRAKQFIGDKEMSTPHSPYAIDPPITSSKTLSLDKKSFPDTTAYHLISFPVFVKKNKDLL